MREEATEKKNINQKCIIKRHCVLHDMIIVIIFFFLSCEDENLTRAILA